MNDEGRLFRLTTRHKILLITYLQCLLVRMIIIDEYVLLAITNGSTYCKFRLTNYMKTQKCNLKKPNLNEYF